MDGFCEPAYGDRSLGDVVPAVAAALGHPLGVAPRGLDLPGASSYVVFLIDGLGANLLRAQRRGGAVPLLAAGRASTIGTAGVPSTTSTSLTSLGTGLVPGGHGLVGFTTRVPGTDDLLNALVWDADVDPLEWQPHHDGVLPVAGVRRAGERRQQARVQRQRAHGGRPPRGGLRRRRPRR